MTNTIARSLARQHKISVNDKEVDDVVARVKSSGGDLSQILGESFNFTESELRRYIKDNILRQKVARELDAEAPKRAEAILAEIKAGKLFADVARASSEDLETKQLGGDIGVVEKGRANLPPEVSDKVFQLQPGQVSDVIKTSSDYFIVTVTEKVDENRSKVSIIRIKVKDTTQYLKEYREQNKVKEYIKLQQSTADQPAQ
jgi:parvulin-like peptidyl-prolyl isomerase